MSLKLVDAGISNRLTQLQTNWNATPLKLHLYSNNQTPTTSSVIGDFTECTFAGYAAQNLTTWTAPSVAAHVASMTAAALTFTRSTTGALQNIYGYYVTTSGGTLLWAEIFSDAPRVVTNAGDSLTVTAAMSDQDLST